MRYWDVRASTAVWHSDLGFQDKLWRSADELRGNMDAAEYKHVVLGLVFLKYTCIFRRAMSDISARRITDAEGYSPRSIRRAERLGFEPRHHEQEPLPAGLEMLHRRKSVGSITGLAIVALTGQPIFDADLHRLDGDLLLATGGLADEAAARYHRALRHERERPQS